MAISSSTSFSSYLARDPTIQSALNEWKIAHKSLVNGVQSFLAASVALRAVCVGSSYAFESPTIKVVLTAIDSELNGLALQEDRLHDARISLATMRNKSSTLVRINALPPEILAHIFMLSRICCVHDNDLNPHTVLEVCAYWRRIAMNTPGLWNHIDITPHTPDGLVELMLERTQGIPLYVHIYEPRSAGPKVGTTENMQVLAPHIRRVRALDVESYGDSENFVEAVLGLWFGGGTELPKSLKVKRPIGPRLLSFKGKATTGSLTDLSDTGAETSSLFGILHLENVYLSLDSACYHGLVELELGFRRSGGVPISLPQLAGIFSASPSLAILKLEHLMVIPTKGWSQPIPIALNCLKVLRIAIFSPESLIEILPLINLSASTTEVSLEMTNINHAREVLAGFFMGSQLTTLHCRARNRRGLQFLHLLLTPLPRLNTLILHGFSLYAESPVPPLPASPICQATVILLKCDVYFTPLKNIIAEHGIRDLRLEQCNPSMAAMQDIRTSLLKIYPELQCSVSDTDSTSKICCRTMFGRAAFAWGAI